MGKGKHLTIDKIAAIGALCKAKHSNKQIHALTGISLRSVQRWTKFFREMPRGSDKEVQKKQSGRPRKVDRRFLNSLKRQVDREPHLTARQLKQRNESLSGVSVRTVSRILRRDLGFKCRRAKKKPLLTKRQKVNRVKFSKAKLKWPKRKVRSILWSDESTMAVNMNNFSSVRMRPGSDPYDPKYTCKTVKHPDKLMVWAAISYSGVGELVVLPKKSNC